MSEITFNEISININILKQLLDQTCTVLTLLINFDNIKLIIESSLPDTIAIFSCNNGRMSTALMSCIGC